MAFQDTAQHTWVWANQGEIDCQGHQLHWTAQALHLCWDLGAVHCPQAPDSMAQKQLKSLENKVPRSPSLQGQGQQLRAPVEHEGKAAFADPVSSPFSPCNVFFFAGGPSEVSSC